jgi:hypothetical protein
MHITVNGKRWKLEFVPPRELRHTRGGIIDGPTIPNKRMLLSRALKRHPARLMEITIHELLHASAWSMDEEWVAQTAKDISRVLTNLGFTREQ